MNENNLNIELFHSPGARSDRVKMLLELMEFPYELTIIDLVRQENSKRSIFPFFRGGRRHAHYGA